MRVNVIITYPTPNAIVIAVTAPITIASTEPATTDHSRRSSPGWECNGTAASATSIGVHGRRNNGSPRGIRTDALAFLRQPVRTRATIANPAIQAA